MDSAAVTFAPESESSLRQRVFLIFSMLTLIIGGLFVSEGYYAAIDFGRRMEQEAFETTTKDLAEHILKAHPDSLPADLTSHIASDSALFIVANDQRRLLGNRLGEQISAFIESSDLDSIQSHATTDHDHEEDFVEEHLLETDHGEYTWSYHHIDHHGVLLAIKRLATHRIAMDAVLVRLATSSMVVLWIGFWAAFGVAAFVAKRVARSNEAILHAANIDAITDLSNQNVLIKTLREARAGDYPISLGMLSIANLRLFEQTYGNVIRLKLLARIGQLISEQLTRESDTQGGLHGRYDGDVFFILLQQSTSDNAERLLQRLAHHLEQAITEQGASLLPAIRMGLASQSTQCEDELAIITHAMLAMRDAEENRVLIRTYTPELESISVKKMRRSAELLRALHAKEFTLLYQPKIHLGDGRIVGVEALVRWNHPTEGRLPPGEFLDLVETSSIARNFSQYIFEHALEQLSRWHAEGLAIPVAINLSPYDLADDQLLRHIEDRLTNLPFPAHYIEFELTETATTIDVTKTSAAFHRLEALGLSRSIDDFGTGMSSLSYLRQIPFTTVKIDRAFIRDITSDSTSQAIVESVLTMAGKIGWDVIAEGIETASIADQLRLMGCRYGQGFFFARPMSGDEVASLMRAQAVTPAAPNRGAQQDSAPA